METFDTQKFVNVIVETPKGSGVKSVYGKQNFSSPSMAN